MADRNHAVVKRRALLRKALSIMGLDALLNMCLRGSTLVLRFALSFYIVKFMGLEAAGVYGLALGTITAAPAILGWGLNYFIVRDISAMPRGPTGVYLKTRLAVTIASLSIMTLLLLVAAYSFAYPVTLLYVLVLVIVWLETIACDIQPSLIARGMSTPANVLFFLRTSSWVLPVIGLGLLFEPFCTIQTVLIGWALGYLLMFAGLVYVLREWPLRRVVRAPIRYDWIKSRMRRSWLIHISDMSNVGLVYADRYIVSLLLSLSLTGVYTFYWSLANALQTLIATAVLQTAIPKLFNAYNGGSMVEWRRVMTRQFVRTGVLALALGVAIFLAGNMLVHIMNMSALSEYIGIFALLLLTAAVRSCSDLMGFGLNSLRQDGHYAFINLFSVVLSVSMSFVLISTFGFVGAGLSSFFTALTTASLSAVVLWRVSRTLET